MLKFGDFLQWVLLGSVFLFILALAATKLKLR